MENHGNTRYIGQKHSLDAAISRTHEGQTRKKEKKQSHTATNANRHENMEYAGTDTRVRTGDQVTAGTMVKSNTLF